MISIITTIAGTLVGGLIFFYICDSLSSRKSPNCFSRTAHLSWKMLKQLYGINPERWKYTKVIKNGYSSFKGWNKVILYNTVEDTGYNYTFWSEPRWCNGYHFSEHIVRVKLPFFGWLAFNYNRIFNKKKDSKGTEMLLDSVSKDIEKVRQKAQEQIAEANKMMQEAARRINLQ